MRTMQRAPIVIYCAVHFKLLEHRNHVVQVLPGFKEVFQTPNVSAL